MRRKWMRLFAPMAVALCMALALPLMSSAVDLERKCSLTVNLTNNPELAEELAEAEIAIDVYRVAKAVPQGGDGSDAYGFQGIGAYTDLSLTEGEGGEAWQEAAQEAARIVRDDLADGQEALASLGWAATLERNEAGEYSASSLEAGLYLLIARGEGLTKEEYFTVLPGTDEDGDSQDGGREGPIATLAYSDIYMYTFLPELVALPNREAESDGSEDPAEGGEWIYDLTVYMKPGRDARFGSLEIVKTVLTYGTVDDPDGSSDGEGGAAADSGRTTFVFNIEATLGGRTVYSDVVAVTFDSPGEKKILIDKKIPVGAEVTVTEVYSGASYTLTVMEWNTSNVISATELASVSFVNEYDPSVKRGHGIINHFEPVMDASGTWIYEWVSAEDALDLPVTDRNQERGPGAGTEGADASQAQDSPAEDSPAQGTDEIGDPGQTSAE